MAWTVAFALLGALIFSMTIAPVLAEVFFRKGVSEWHNPVMEFLRERYRHSLRWAVEHKESHYRLAPAFRYIRGTTLQRSDRVRLPTAPDEGAIWARGTLAPSTGPTEETK